MAIVKVDKPTASTAIYVPDIETDYNSQNDYIEDNIAGYNAVTLTNWDSSTTAPQVEVASIIEDTKAFWGATGNESISTSGASAGTVYLILDDTTPEYKWTNTVPAWVAGLNGWYVSGDRFTGHFCEWDGATAFWAKREYGKGVGGDLNIIPIGSAGLYPPGGTITISCSTANSPQTLAILGGKIHLGEMTLTPSGTNGDTVEITIVLQIYVNTTWYDLNEQTASFLIGTTLSAKTFAFFGQMDSTGSNYRFLSTVTNTSGVGVNSVSASTRAYGYMST